MAFTIDASGLTQRQALALAAVMACKPCCDGDDGEGSGSGSGGGDEGTIIPCCGEVFEPTTISWEVTGVTCGDVDCLTGTRSELDIQDPDCTYLVDNMPEGWQLRAGVVGFTLTCEEGDLRTVVFIDLCCIELIEDTTQTQVWLNVSFSFSDLATTWLRVYRVLTNLWDFGSCEAGILEVSGRAMFLDDTLTVGETTCDFPDPRISVVFT